MTRGRKQPPLVDSVFRPSLRLGSRALFAPPPVNITATLNATPRLGPAADPWRANQTMQEGLAKLTALQQEQVNMDKLVKVFEEGETIVLPPWDQLVSARCPS